MNSLRRVLFLFIFFYCLSLFPVERFPRKRGVSLWRRLTAIKRPSFQFDRRSNPTTLLRSYRDAPNDTPFVQRISSLLSSSLEMLVLIESGKCSSFLPSLHDSGVDLGEAQQAFFFFVLMKFLVPPC